MSKNSKSLSEEIRNLLLEKTAEDSMKSSDTAEEVEIEISAEDDAYGEDMGTEASKDEMADAEAPTEETKKCEETDAYGMTEGDDSYTMDEADAAALKIKGLKYIGRKAGGTGSHTWVTGKDERGRHGEYTWTPDSGMVRFQPDLGGPSKTTMMARVLNRTQGGKKIIATTAADAVKLITDYDKKFAEATDAYGMTEGDDPYAMKEADAYGMTEGDDPYAMKEANAYGVTEAEDPYAMAEEDDMELDVEKDVKEMVEKSKSAVKLEVFSEKLNALIAEDKSLSEEFKKNAATLFEAALSEKLANLSETFEAAITTQLKSHYDFVVEKVDGYLTYAVEAVIENNQDKVDSKLRNEIAESFIADLKEAFEKNYIEVPEGKVDVYAKAESENKKLSEKADRLVAANKELNEKLVKLSKEKIVREASEGLYVTQIDRLKKLTESVEFVDEKTFANKVKVIRETYFSKVNHGKSEKDSAPVQNTVVKTRVVEDTLTEESDSVMGKYAAAISRHAKR